MEKEKLWRRYFLCGLVIMCLGFVFWCLWTVFGFSFGKMLPECFFHAYTGYYCFGCGGTRAVEALFQGDFVESVRFHIFPVYVSVLFLSYMLSYVLFLVTGRRVRPMGFHPTYFYVLIAAVILQCVLKNFLLYR